MQRKNRWAVTMLYVAATFLDVHAFVNADTEVKGES